MCLSASETTVTPRDGDGNGCSGSALMSHTRRCRKITISTAKGCAGTYLVGADGRAIYLWVADSNGQSSCSGACAKAWPPVVASTTPSVSGGVNAANLGWANRSGGQKQVTYKRHPL